MEQSYLTKLVVNARSRCEEGRGRLNSFKLRSPFHWKMFDGGGA